MPTYKAYFHTDAEWASREFEADTPERALALARQFYDESPSSLYFESYDSGTVVNEITIIDPDGNMRTWFDDDMRLRRAAQHLLDALEQAVAALNQTSRFAVPGLDTDSYRIASICDQAIAKAKGR